MSDITVGRETVEFLGLRRAILTETVLSPETYAGMKNIEAPFGTVNRIRSGLTTFPLASLRYASRASSTAFENGRRFLTSASVTRSKSPSSRSEEHTSELQSRQYLVCRLLLEKKKKK